MRSPALLGLTTSTFLLLGMTCIPGVFSTPKPHILDQPLKHPRISEADKKQQRNAVKGLIRSLGHYPQSDTASKDAPLTLGQAFAEFSHAIWDVPPSKACIAAEEPDRSISLHIQSIGTKVIPADDFALLKTVCTLYAYPSVPTPGISPAHLYLSRNAQQRLVFNYWYLLFPHDCNTPQKLRGCIHGKFPYLMELSKPKTSNHFDEKLERYDAFLYSITLSQEASASLKKVIMAWNKFNKGIMYDDLVNPSLLVSHSYSSTQSTNALETPATLQANLNGRVLLGLTPVQEPLGTKRVNRMQEQCIWSYLNLRKALKPLYNAPIPEKLNPKESTSGVFHFVKNTFGWTEHSGRSLLDNVTQEELIQSARSHLLTPWQILLWTHRTLHPNHPPHPHHDHPQWSQALEVMCHDSEKGCNEAISKAFKASSSQ
ncbi:hypothetical protein BJ684DRAFT_20600 [Piptocephalis cylindrospora]|uniref:Uncharacterized protein n=1 Tax=Piptocephalis cylindrospora TaxID=1907219 RepID=A0A4P9Y230_9FUNG|nr:hypothetical protein BJ684DRAFT_20600 [Piptocephalis cylindrospora]|eukprot:RKP12877.1 hypothetical protein BJ684DRAFT_20600 [Piptocephalis cylindrospora]